MRVGEIHAATGRRLQLRRGPFRAPRRIVGRRLPLQRLQETNRKRFWNFHRGRRPHGQVGQRLGKSGKAVHYEFCPECGTTVRWRVELIANRHVYAAGTLDDRTAIEGVGEMRALLQSAVEIILRPVDVPPPQGSHLFRTGRNGLRVGRTPQPLRKSA
jgi:hypothetical protein